MAMRKVFYGPEGIMLRHVLRMYDKESLLNYARDLEIRRGSKVLNSIHVSGIGLELMPKLNPRKSVVRFAVKKEKCWR